MSCNTIVFDRQLTQQELEGLTIEKMEGIFRDYAKNFLGENFEIKGNNVRIKGTPTNSHYVLMNDLNEKLGYNVFEAQDYSNYVINLENLQKLLQVSMEVANRSYEVIEQTDLFDEAFLQNEQEFREDFNEQQEQDSQIVSEESIEKYIEYLESKKDKYILRLAEITKKVKELNKRIRMAKEENDTVFINESLAEITNLENEKQQIRDNLYGNVNLGNKSIESKIDYLKNPENQTFEILTSMADRDLSRVRQLTEDGYIGREAYHTIDFYLNLADFSQDGINNPLFKGKDLEQLSEEMKLKLSNIASRFKMLQQEISMVEEKRLDKIIQENVQNTFSAREFYQKIFKEEMGEMDNTLTEQEQEIKDLEKLRKRLFENTGSDISVLSYLLLDISTSFESVGYTSKLILSELDNDISYAWANIGQTVENFEKIYDKAEKELKKIGKNNLLFKQVDSRTGKIQQKLVTRFTNVFTNTLENLEQAVKKNFKNAKLKRHTYLKNNAIAVDVRVLPEIQKEFGKKFEKDNFKNDNNKHREELIKLLGEKGYQDVLEEQRNKIKEYLVKKRAIENNIISQYYGKKFESKDRDKILNEILDSQPFAKDAYTEILRVSPFQQLEDYDRDFYQRNNFVHNTFVPKDSKHFDSNFKIIEENKTLSEFYDTMKEMLEYINDSMPAYMQNGQNPLNFTSMKKGFREELTNPLEREKWYFLSAISKKSRDLLSWLLDFFRARNFETLSENFNEETKFFDKKINPNTYFKNNKASITAMFNLDAMEMLSDIKNFNKERLGEEVESIYSKLNKFTKFPINEMPGNVIMSLAEKSNIQAQSIEEAKNKLLKMYDTENNLTIPVGEILMSDVIHKHQVEETLDFKKLLTYAYTQAAIFRTKNDVAPKIELLIRQYKESHGDNSKAVKRIESWANRALYDNRDKKFALLEGVKKIEEKGWISPGLFKKLSQETGKKESEVTEKDAVEYMLKSLNQTKRFGTRTEKKLAERIKEVSEKDLTQDQKIMLRELAERTKPVFSMRAAFSKGWLHLQRLIGLGWRFTSMGMNFGAGQSINLQFDSQGLFWTPGNITKNRFTQYSGILGYWSQGLFKSKKAKKLRLLIDKYQLLQDARNTLQQSVGRQKMMKHLGTLVQPFEHIQRIEYLNQSPIVHAILMDTKIEGKSGKVSNILDAMDTNGRLKEDFRTPKNIKNWEQINVYDKSQVEEFTTFRGRVLEAIKSAHGDYSDIGGNVMKDYFEGNLTLMFKNWWARQVHWRFHGETVNTYTITEEKRTKGRYRSHSYFTATLAGTAVGVGLMSPIGAFFGFGSLGYSLLIGAGTGVIGKNLYDRIAITNRKDRVSMGTTPLTSFLTGVAMTKMFVLKTLGIPFSMLGIDIQAGKFSQQNQIEELVKKGFKDIDARNTMANLTSIAAAYNLLGALAIVTLLIKGEDDDDEDRDIYWLKKEEQLKNYLINNLFRLYEEINMYSYPPAFATFLFDRFALLNWTDKNNRTLGLFYNYMFNPKLDIDPTTGESKFKRQAAKSLPMPFAYAITGKVGVFEDVYIENPFKTLGEKDAEKLDAKEETGGRKNLKNQIIEEEIEKLKQDKKARGEKVRVTQGELKRIKKFADKKVNILAPTTRQQEIKAEQAQKRRAKESAKFLKEQGIDLNFEDDIMKEITKELETNMDFTE